ncbi:hypothetical protein X770_28740 [Mesorhizobium sp. LSJC269B00]|nr:hypothetical protein X770_28740 [Mesorhizobium sp. LSJC269B00]ESZ38540.1 hypothetical protein X731_28895 [Mesorhizobium sp. L2C054A000]ESZ40083.1 hypothetical protein X732_12225 [Mesorhizobium sp. L2C066B000]ESZ65261.1 hypothetical protein X728_07110 [Mesorhizobium sp. L103C120A0]
MFPGVLRAATPFGEASYMMLVQLAAPRQKLAETAGAGW